MTTINLEQREQLIESIHGIVIGRWFLIVGLSILGVIQIVAGIAVISLTWWMFAVVVAVPVVYNSVYSFCLKRPSTQLSDRRLHILTFLQVLVDQVMFTVIIYVTGGVESVAYLLYFFPILSATILYSDLEIISFSILTTFWYSSVIVLEYNGIIPHLQRYSHDPGFVGNAEVTLANTLSITLIIVFTAMFSVFVNRIIHDRELQITVERDKVRSILNSLEDGIIILDNEKRVLLINPPARDMLRMYEDFVGPELIKDDFSESFAELIQVIRDQPKTKQLGQEVKVTEGEHSSHIQVDAIPIHAADGSIISWIKMLHDITREKELDSIKSDFISIAAHQLRTPLAALKWFFKIMLEGDAGEMTPQQQEFMEKAYTRNDEVIEIVNNLLDISEIEEGRFPYEFTEQDLTVVIEEIFKSVQIDAERCGVGVQFDRPSTSLPPIEIDKQKLRIAIQNLVDNAIKYSPKGSKVTITTRLKNNRYYVSIADQGIGIAKEDQPKIFSKFFRGKNAREKETTGSGLGLYIVKNIVQKHRGQIWFESEVGNGSTFYITLPVLRKYL